MGHAIVGSACSPTPINHAGTSKAGVTCDSSIRACAEVRGGATSVEPGYQERS